MGINGRMTRRSFSAFREVPSGMTSGSTSTRAQRSRIIRGISTAGMYIGRHLTMGGAFVFTIPSKNGLMGKAGLSPWASITREHHSDSEMRMSMWRRQKGNPRVRPSTWP